MDEISHTKQCKSKSGGCGAGHSFDDYGTSKTSDDPQCRECGTGTFMNETTHTNANCLSKMHTSSSCGPGKNFEAGTSKTRDDS